MQIIKNWLKGKRDFKVGAMLYQRFGKNEQLKKLLDSGKTPFAEKELFAELTKIAAEGTPKIVAAVDKEMAVMPDNSNPILDALTKKWKPLYARMNLLRHELDRYDERNDWEAIAWREPRAREIKELEMKCKAVWAEKDYYEKHGQLPFVQEKKLLIPTDPVKAAKLLNNIKKNIRRNRLEMKKPGADAKYAQLYQDYKVAYRELTGEDYEEKD